MSSVAIRTVLESVVCENEKKKYYKMKIAIVFCSFALACFALPASPYRKQIADNSKTATIVQQDYINGGTGYNFAYETSDGVSRQEQAELKNPGTKDETIVVQGSYTYVGSDGNTYTVTYIADENGYRPTGQHLPAL